MRILPEPRRWVPCLIFLVSSVLFSATLSLARVVEVVGYAESKIQNPHAFSGLRVTIECKVEKEHFVTKGSGNLDEEGKFSLKVSPRDIVSDSDEGALKEECYAQLHSAAGTPCPAHDGLESNKIVFLYKSGDKHVLGLKQKLKFSPQLCVSKFFWPMPPFKGFDHHLPLPPPVVLPPFPKLKKPCPPPPAEVPPPVPVHEPPPKVELPPPVPVHDPPSKVEPVPKKPCPPKPPKIEYPPPVPLHKPPPIPKKPCPPKPPKIELPPPVPVHKPPPKKVDPPKKPCPPKPPKMELPPPVPKIEHPPIYVPPVVIPKKPCPPLPPLPKFPPKYIDHPKLGKWPPLPPTHP